MTNKQITTSEFWDLVDRTNITDPKKKDLKALRKALRNNPELWRQVGDLAEIAFHNLIKGFEATAALKESLEIGWQEMQIELGGENPNPLEKLLIQQVVMSWLRLQLAEYYYTVKMNQSISLTLGKYWEGRLSAAQRRFLRAIETLARVKRILARIPPLQVNIATQGGQQVNIAGVVETGKKK